MYYLIFYFYKIKKININNMKSGFFLKVFQYSLYSKMKNY